MRTLCYPLKLNFLPLVDMIMPKDRRITEPESSSINPELTEYLSKHGLLIGHQEIFYSPPGFNGIIHVDGSRSHKTDAWPSRCKLNFVTENPEVVTTWFDVLPEDKNKTRNWNTMVSTNFLSFNADACIEIETLNVTGWHLFEAVIPHVVRNKSTSPRWCVSFVLNIDELQNWVTMDEVINRLMSPSFNG
jgi:hypothetical protein